jgi:hypothetical protein
MARHQSLARRVARLMHIVLRLVAQRRLHQLVQRNKKSRLVRFSKRRRPAGAYAKLSKMPRKLAACHRAANIGLRPDLSNGRDRRRPLCDAARRQRDIRGHANIHSRDALDDPVIRLVGTLANSDHAHIRATRRQDGSRAIRDDEHLQAEAIRDPEDFRANRTRVAVNVDIGQGQRQPRAGATWVRIASMTWAL